jgi:hypothetical protein
VIIPGDSTTNGLQIQNAGNFIFMIPSAVLGTNLLSRDLLYSASGLRTGK